MYYIEELSTTRRCELIDITATLRLILSKANLQNGMCYVFVPHTTAAVTINENADPDVCTDMISYLDKAIDNKCHYRHMEGNSPAHIKASMMGSSAAIIIDGGDLVLGRWQGVYFCEFDGPRRRKFFVKMIADV
jgi:secondary thiamine-phosphate synthase enzyme